MTERQRLENHLRALLGARYRARVEGSYKSDVIGLAVTQHEGGDDAKVSYWVQRNDVPRDYGRVTEVRGDVVHGLAIMTGYDQVMTTDVKGEDFTL